MFVLPPNAPPEEPNPVAGLPKVLLAPPPKVLDAPEPKVPAVLEPKGDWF